MIFQKLMVVVVAALISFSATAGTHGDALATCLADSTSGKDRKDLARWMFLAMAAHPDMRELSAASKDAAEQASRSVGMLFTRLVAENCSTQVRALVKNEGPESLRTAFEFLGKLAMQELMTNREVNASITAIDRYIDRSKTAAVLGGK